MANNLLTKTQAFRLLIDKELAAMAAASRKIKRPERKPTPPPGLHGRKPLPV